MLWNECARVISRALQKTGSTIVYYNSLQMWLCNYNGFTSAVVISESKQYGSNHTPRTAGTAYWPSNPRRRLSQSHLTTDTAMAVLPDRAGHARAVSQWGKVSSLVLSQTQALLPPTRCVFRFNLPRNSVKPFTLHSPGLFRACLSG